MEPITIEVRYYAQLRRTAGVKEETFSLSENGSVAELLRAVTGAHPELMEALFDDEGALYEHVRVIINGHDLAHQPEGTGTQLADGDSVSIFPAIGGG
jgi:molybdopterin synthase sulfur carrier subunit